ncbi:c-type cytochrome [uncultured Imperialibacter sp.]|uniref:DUF7133 domain-containing protein n=1 Tax=uncultured Imperialibacter sp. TaxID=1672639 RepID=UPI0030DC6C25|tara:strand:+ start:32163 stop:34493 length:2331 start_codon:yes stop_codon:yes gene_type:complete
MQVHPKDIAYFLLLISMSVVELACTPEKVAEQDSHPFHSVSAFNPAPSPEYLSPQESLKTIYLPDGYHIELVASEPMIKEPVAIAWDGNARMYVAEMMTYMQDADASGEQQPASRISLLEDTNNDGKMDKRTTFIDSLLLPRMIQCVGDELLVNETNTINIYSYKDTDGDGIADVKKQVYKNDAYKVNDANMEHQRSGLDWNLDNWMYVTYDPVRFRYTNGLMQVDTMASGSNGQWGVTHDNYGRIFYSRAGGEIPALGFQINPSYGSLDFPDQFNAAFSEVWPIIATPDVQGGSKRLRPNNTLNHFTAPCGQSIFRGDRLPEDFVGDYVVCEPVARTIRRAKLVNDEGKTRLKNIYDHQEFISSTDMNFRPVNTATGPDGNLYIVDMHRGIIQQGNWTKPNSFLRNKIDSLGLDKNVGHGRIYRVVNDDFEPGPQPKMLNETTQELLGYLDHSNGWWRDNAQKEIIVRGDRSVAPALVKMATGRQKVDSPLGRIHALWTLEGLGALNKEVLQSALQDDDPQVRRTAIWISESYIKANDKTMIGSVARMKEDKNDDVKVQVLLSLYQSKDEQAKQAIDDMLDLYPDKEMLVATKGALDRNEDVKAFGSKLGNMIAADRSLILEGASIFKSLCASCHGEDGAGLAIGGGSMPAPPLKGSKQLAFVKKEEIIRILLHGLTGPIEGKEYSSVMPPMGANSDEWVASVVSYIRYEFGGRPPRNPDDIPGMAASARDSVAGFTVKTSPSPAVTPEEVKRVRESTKTKDTPWTLEELEKISK